MARKVKPAKTTSKRQSKAVVAKPKQELIEGDGFFGIEFPKTKKEKKAQEKNRSFVTPTNDDGAVVVEGGLLGTYIDIDGTVKNEFELITRYREMSLHAELNTAIDQITNEAIVIEDTKPPVEIDLSEADPEILPKSVAKKIEKEFDVVLKLLDFENQGYEIFRKWYIDGRLYYHAVPTDGDENEGIKEVRYIDPRQIRKIRVIEREIDEPTGTEIVKIIDEYYAYNQRGIQYPQGMTSYGGVINAGQGSSVTGIRINKDAITFVHSGITDRYSSTILSHLHQSIRPLNQLKMMEDASVIYRLVRAPERRIFYIDVMDLPKTKADQYMREMMQRYRNKLVYDAGSGEVRDDRRYSTMIEDFWLPRRNGQNVTQIDTLQGGENLGEIRDIEYFLRKLYKSLNIPLGRLDPNNAFNVGRASEITRDEVNFAKFITRLRLRFSMLFDSLLEKQLILKKIISKDDWPDVKQQICYKFAKDNFFSELKENEILKEKMAVLAMVDPYANKYFSVNWIRKNVLHQTKEDIEEIDKEITKEEDKYPPVNGPNAVIGVPGNKQPGASSGPPKGTGGNEIAGGADNNGTPPDDDIGSI